MELVLYTAAQSRGFMVEWLLEELALPYTRVSLDLGAGEHKSEDYQAIHPLGGKGGWHVEGDGEAEGRERQGVGD